MSVLAVVDKAAHKALDPQYPPPPEDLTGVVVE
jgi:hypothetical protein